MHMKAYRGLNSSTHSNSEVYKESLFLVEGKTMKTIRKKGRLTWRNILDVIESPIQLISTLFSKHSGAVIILTYIITGIILLNRTPIDYLVIALVILLITIIHDPFDVERLTYVWLYLMLFRAILGTISANMKINSMAIGIALAFDLGYCLTQLRKGEMKIDLFGVVYSTGILAYIISTIILTSITNVGDINTEYAKVIDYYRIQESHFLEVKVESVENELTFHTNSEIYDQCVEDGYVLVNVYQKWGVECCRLKDKTGAFHGFL